MAVLGLDLGASKLLARGVDAGGAVVFRDRRATGRGLGPDAALAMIDDVVARARAALGRIDAIGIGFPGLVDHGAGVARSSVMLDGWRDHPLAAAIADRAGAPCAVDNDVNAAAVHEQAARGARDLLLVAVGTGIGGALVLDGQLRRGHGGLAGEIGHVSIDRDGPRCDCGRRGCVNRYASGTAIELAAGLPPGSLVEAAARGEPALVEAVEIAADALGAAIGSALNLVDVPLVVLGGGVAGLGDRFVAAVAARARRECFAEIGGACRFETARGGPEAAALGAAMLARQAIAAGHAAARASASSSAA